MTTIHVPYGVKGKIDFEIPDENLVLDTDVPFPDEVPDLELAILNALDHPVAGLPFSERLAKARKVVILQDNFARLTPAYKILPPILNKIREAGKEVEILVASGLLREMNEAELQRKFGDEILKSGVPIFQSVARARWDFEFLGVTSYGTPIHVHRRLLQADLSLAVTMTQATLWGYGGGGSMILPGVSSYETIEWNHRLMTCPTSGVGYEPPLNRLRADIEEALLMSGLDMSLLVICNPQLGIIELTAGETIATHRASVAKYRNYYAFDLGKIPGGQLDVAISGSFPGDRFFAHACWPIANLDYFVREGGTILVATPVPGGLAHYSYAKDYMPPTPQALSRLYEDVFYGKQELWHACLWMPIIEVMAKKNVLVVTEPERLPDFEIVQVPAVTSMAEAWQIVRERYGPGVKVGNFPYGKWIVPAQMPIQEFVGRRV
ncbi:MAG: lactate racemase domain-containing protein [Anaerolineae bacterium]